MVYNNDNDYGDNGDNRLDLTSFSAAKKGRKGPF